MENEKAYSIPLGIGENFPNLERLTISSGLIDVNPLSLKNLTKLKSLNLSRNSLTEVGNSTFVNVPSLEQLNVSLNQIKTVDAGSFAVLKELKELDLSENQISKLPEDIFKENSKLSLINLRDNKLKDVSPDVVNNLKSLQLLDLTKNQCVDLKYPKVSLKVLQASLLKNCSKLTRLCCDFLYGIYCSAVDFKITREDTKLAAVMSDEDCKAEDSFGPFLELKNDKKAENITHLTIHNANVSYLPNNLADSFPRLSSLIVTNSQLMALKKSNLIDMIVLTQIDVGGNKLTSFESGLFDEQLYLSHFVCPSTKSLDFHLDFSQKWRT